MIFCRQWIACQCPQRATCNWKPKLPLCTACLLTSPLLTGRLCLNVTFWMPWESFLKEWRNWASSPWRKRQIRLQWPHFCTCMWTVHKNPLPCAWTIYGMVVDLAQVFNHTEVGQSVPGLKMYPSSPSQLAKDWLKKAYGNEEPSMSDLSVATFYPKIPLRSTSSLLWAEAPAHCKHLQKGNAKNEHADPLMSKLNDFMEKWDSKQDQEKLQNMQHSRMNPLPLQNTGQQAMSGLPGWPVQPSAGSRPDHAGLCQCKMAHLLLRLATFINCPVDLSGSASNAFKCKPRKKHQKGENRGNPAEKQRELKFFCVHWLL